MDTTYVYQAVAKREGEFTIPSVSVSVNGKSYSTRPIAVKVQKGGKRANETSSEIGFAEIDVEKKTAYVGEVVPVEVRLYIRAGVRPEIANTIEIAGDGFTVQKAPEPLQQSEMRNSLEYHVFTYRTVMTPTKAGKLSVGPSSVPFVAQLPQPAQQRQRRSFGGMVFDDFFDSLGGGFGERRRYDAKAPAIELDVKPLPSEGRPKSYSGAVGQFQFKAEGSPTRLKVGDPVTMRLTVSGTGNFDRVTAPAMDDTKGWQGYDASEKFEPVDAMKTTGTKTFEVPIVPDGPYRQTPTFTFAFFDPKTEKYVTRRSEPQALTIEGAAAVASVPAQPEKESAPVVPEPEKPEPKPAVDLLGLRYELGTVETFAPVFKRREFWLAQGIPALGLLALVTARLMRRDPHRSRHGRLERQRNEIWKRARTDQNPVDFWEHAARVVQLDTAIVAGVDPGSVDLDVVNRTRAFDAETKAGIEEIFERRGALLFAGRASSEGQILPEHRRRILESLEKLCRR